MEAAQSGVEVRTIHIIYFLCRKGHIEDPHLIRVHQLSKNGIRLRDIKRWLAELRGKDMPESFAWSYKRKYMKGYVWQDLLDDDLITPHFNNEYVLKGSEISPSLISSHDTNKEANRNISMQKEPLLEEAKEKPSIEDHLIQKKSSSEIEEELPESTLPNDFMKVHEEIKKITMENEKSSSTKSDNNSSSTKSKSKSHGSVKMFTNFITCRTFETKESVIVPSVKSSFDEANKKCGEICKVQQRTNGKYYMNKPRNGSRCDGATEPTSFCSPRKSSAIYYMPLNGPTCSQCGKQFKPEKLHSHMLSCKGIKAIAKGSYPPTIPPNNAVENRPLNTAESIYRQSVSGSLLTH
ncbi:hypothetical protein LIER_19048 [Lithospermum erythrorhizon]|uniref:SOSEKI DIX-like domain-containing protein n=1 Tax=Lithospermum erythrorhizon TaxID=34254 RepID=A0AAV3QGD3_LITER